MRFCVFEGWYEWQEYTVSCATFLIIGMNQYLYCFEYFSGDKEHFSKEAFHSLHTHLGGRGRGRESSLPYISIAYYMQKGKQGVQISCKIAYILMGGPKHLMVKLVLLTSGNIFLVTGNMGEQNENMMICSICIAYYSLMALYLL